MCGGGGGGGGAFKGLTMNDKFYEDSSGRSKIMRHFEKNGGGGGGGSGSTGSATAYVSSFAAIVCARRATLPSLPIAFRDVQKAIAN